MEPFFTPPPPLLNIFFPHPGVYLKISVHFAVLSLSVPQEVPDAFPLFFPFFGAFVPKDNKLCLLKKSKRPIIYQQ